MFKSVARSIGVLIIFLAISPSVLFSQTSGSAVAGLMLNNTYATTPSSVEHQYKIATLPASTYGTFDHLHLVVTVNNGWGAAGKSYIDAVFANRAGFTYQYTLRGHSADSAVRLVAYQPSDGSVDIYLDINQTAYGTASYTVLENLQETVYSSPADVGSSPLGTLVFDSSSSTYPPATYIDFSGNQTVQGNLKLRSNSGASITFSDGTTQSTAWTGSLCGGDYAEAVDVSGDRTHYEPGDVLVIDVNEPGKFLKSSEPYSTAITGVYSTKPGVVGRRQTTSLTNSKAEVPMAMVGIVPTKVSTENGPIKPGDFLVTSSTLGYAMKGTDRSRMFGAVVGKALGTLDSGVGVIEAVILLQ